MTTKGISKNAANNEIDESILASSFLFFDGNNFSILISCSFLGSEHSSKKKIYIVGKSTFYIISGTPCSYAVEAFH